MCLNDKLRDLVGHEIFPTTTVPDDNNEVPGGTLIDVGDDYIVIDTKKEEEFGDVGAAAIWYVKLDAIISIGHPSDCRRCAVDTAQNPA